MTRVVRDEIAEITHCRFCGQQIVWALTARGRRMPIDVDPTPTGIWVVWHYEEEEPIPVHHVSYAPLQGYGELYKGTRWSSHWGTCPQRALARRDVVEVDAPAAQLELFGSGKAAR